MGRYELWVGCVRLGQASLLRVGYYMVEGALGSCPCSARVLLPPPRHRCRHIAAFAHPSNWFRLPTLDWPQGNRITQGISCADVADVCLKALHNPEARNKTFEVGARALDGRLVALACPVWLARELGRRMRLWSSGCAGQCSGPPAPNPCSPPLPAQVCFEYQPEEGLEFYELISHLPGASGGHEGS